MTVEGEDPSARALAVLRVVRLVLSLAFVGFCLGIAFLVYLLVRG